MNIDFGALLGRAWKITWENKVLWLFGILAALGSGMGGSNTNYRFDSGDFTNWRGNLPNLPPNVERFFEQAGPMIAVAALALVCLGLILGVVFIVLSVIGRGGLISGVLTAEAGKKVTFSEAWGAGVANFWRLFVIQLVVGVAGLVVSLFSFVAFITICLAPLACIGFIAVAVLGVIAYFAQIAAVTENLQLGAALSRAWEVIKANLAPIVVLGIVLAVVTALIGFVLALPFVAIVIPAVVGRVTESARVANAMLIFLLACGTVYLPVLLVLSGILHTWVTAVWTLAYQQFTRPAAATAVAVPQ
jgi:hypothetical protein